MSRKMSSPVGRIEPVVEQEGARPAGPRASGRRWHQMSTVMSPDSVAEALEMVRAGLGYLATADAASLAAQTQAECLRTLERTDAISTAARASFLSVFTSGQGYSADADYSPRAWLIHQTRVSKGAAVAHNAWARRATTHPQVVAALATGELSESYGRT